MRSVLCCLLLLMAACDGREKERKDGKESQPSEILAAVDALKRASEQGARESEMRSRLSTALKFLPAGITLKDVRIPHYDKSERRAALLRAEVLRVLSEQHVTSDNIELRLFSKEESEVLRVHMGAAEYFVEAGLLEAKEILTVTGEEVSAEGAGGFFQLDSREGFVQGPVSTTLRRKAENKDEKDGDSPPADTPPPAPALPPPAQAPLAAPLPEFIEPQPLTKSELAAIDALLKSRSKSVLADRAPTQEFLISGEKAREAAESGLRSFTERIGRGELLSPAGPGAAPQIPLDPAPLGKDEIRVTSQSGMFLDVEHGHLKYLRDVEVREARFTMSCSKDLLIVLEPKPDPDPSADPNREADPATAEPPDRPPGDAPYEELLTRDDFGDFKTIIATGGVRVERHDPAGKLPPIIITGEIAIVDVKSGDMVLQGGSPTIRQGLNLLRAEEPDLYLRYYANGNVFADKGRWTTVGDLASLKTRRDKDNGKEKEQPETKAGDPAAVDPEIPEGAGGREAPHPPAAGNGIAPKNPPAAPQTITVTCTGGMYFDAEEGQIVYLEDVQISEPRFRITCGKELKAFLRRRPEAAAEGAGGLEAFSDLDYLVASGAVTVERHDPKKSAPPASAQADHAILDARSGDIILRGGSPTIRQGENSLVAGRPDLYLRFYENGSLFAEAGPWTTTGDLANLRTKPGEAKKPAQLITATAQGGLSFDALQGEIIYHEDVVVVEPRFRMTCGGEMKIILQERAAKPGERLEGPEAFSDVKGIIARGGVTVVRRDPAGKADPITATAQTAVYEAASGDIVLRDGRPAIRQGKSYAKAEEDGLFIRFYPNGSFYTNTGKWDLKFETKDFEELRNQQQQKEPPRP